MILDFDLESDRIIAAKACLMARGRRRLSIDPIPEQSSVQRAYYFAAVVTKFRDFLVENGTEDATIAYCHKLLKEKWLTVETVVPEAGEVSSRVRSLRELDSAELTHFIEDCRNWLAEFGVHTSDPIRPCLQPADPLRRDGTSQESPAS